MNRFLPRSLPSPLAALPKRLSSSLLPPSFASGCCAAASMRAAAAAGRAWRMRRVAVIAPWEDAAGQPRPLLHQETRRPDASFLTALLRARMDGPALEIYRFGD